MNADIPIAAGILIGLFAVGAVAVRKILGREETEEQRPALETAAVEAPRCVCGELATEPAPTLERGRGSVLRDLIGLPPAYRRVVRRDGLRVWCRVHALLADALLAEFIATDIRAAFSRVYSQVANRAALFESEELPRRVLEALSDGQRKAGKRSFPPTPIRVLKNGTDGGES